MLADDQAGELVWMKGMPHEEDGCSGYKPPVGVISYVSSRGRSRHSHAMQRFQSHKLPPVSAARPSALKEQKGGLIDTL